MRSVGRHSRAQSRQSSYVIVFNRLIWKSSHFLLFVPMPSTLMQRWPNLSFKTPFLVLLFASSGGRSHTPSPAILFGRERVFFVSGQWACNILHLAQFKSAGGREEKQKQFNGAGRHCKQWFSSIQRSRHFRGASLQWVLPFFFLFLLFGRSPCQEEIMVASDTRVSEITSFYGVLRFMLSSSLDWISSTILCFFCVCWKTAFRHSTEISVLMVSAQVQ